MISFVKNTGIQLVFSNKDINQYRDGKDKRRAVSEQVKFSERELELLQKVNKLDIEPKFVKSEKKQTKKEKSTSLTLPEVKGLKAELEGSAYLCEIISDLKLPENEIVPRNPVLEARIQRLKVEQEQREYNSMTKNVDTSRKFEPEETIAFQMKQINRQLIAVAQFVFSVISGFFFGFLGIELIVGNLDFGFRLLLGIICALVIALAEIYFLAKKLSEEDSPPTPVNTGTKLKTN